MNCTAGLYRFWSEEAGGEGLDYPFVAAMIIVVALATWLLLGPQLASVLDSVVGAAGDAAAAG